MEELLVLGQIPFTDVRISFANWLFIVTALLLALVIVGLAHSKLAAIQAYLLNQKVSRLLTHHRLF